MYNAAASSKTVSITIRRRGAEDPHTSRTLELDPGARVDLVTRSKFPMNACYTVSVSVSGTQRDVRV